MVPHDEAQVQYGGSSQAADAPVGQEDEVELQRLLLRLKKAPSRQQLDPAAMDVI